MAGYTSLAYVYDALTENADYPARCNVLCDLLAAHGAGEGILLDLACGTGTLTALLAKRGYDVIGVDASQDMLSLAPLPKLREYILDKIITLGMHIIECRADKDPPVGHFNVFHRSSREILCQSKCVPPFCSCLTGMILSPYESDRCL